MIGKKACTASVEGVIVRYLFRNSSSSLIWVEYLVNGTAYIKKESVKLKSTDIKIGAIPIGQSKSPSLPSLSEGSKVWVCYNPQKPQKAYIRDNTGHQTM